VPPSQFESGSTAVYVLLILGGTGLIGLLPAWLLLRFRKPTWKSGEPAVAAADAAPDAAPATNGSATATSPAAGARRTEAPSPPPPAGAPKPRTRGPDERRNRWMYWAIGAAVVVPAVIGLFAFSAAKTNDDAQAKAQQLEQKLTQAGLPVPASRDQIVNSLGTDGGAVCQNPANALGKATLYDLLSNGASFVGQRPVIVDRNILLGEAAILQVYCPDKAKAYQDTINQLKTRHTVKG